MLNEHAAGQGSGHLLVIEYYVLRHLFAIILCVKSLEPPEEGKSIPFPRKHATLADCTTIDCPSHSGFTTYNLHRIEILIEILSKTKFFRPNPATRWGWVFLEQTRIVSGIQFTMHSIEFFVMETKQLVVSFVNVILTGKPAASARAGLRKANTKRQEIIFPSEFAICS